ncbi:hypothetical protein [Aliikangiella coralliicola]|uniref:Uncharacterized protein n=1 Tax=Aliikangiella coralliicola TaxID=2592383 RepID=A0A545UIX0_9GAMM|nr:hypothetical protein [Aliikangiella coralliicola]TQV89411.1 hypothetical protein FLL46_00580 [Aliikangiella coralliicola]
MTAENTLAQMKSISIVREDGSFNVTPENLEVADLDRFQIMFYTVPNIPDADLEIELTAEYQLDHIFNINLPSRRALFTIKNDRAIIFQVKLGEGLHHKYTQIHLEVSQNPGGYPPEMEVKVKPN